MIFKIKLSIIFLFVSLNFLKNSYAQSLYANYNSITLTLKKPIRLTILADDTLYNNFSKEIELIDNFFDHFNFYSKGDIIDLLNNDEFANLSCKNLEQLTKLKTELKVDLVMELKRKEDGIELNLITTEKGDTIYKNLFRQSLNSNPLKDLIKLLLENKEAKYINLNLPNMTRVNKGTIIIPRTRFKKDTIRVNSDFYISKFEITVKQFSDFIKATNYKTTSEIEEYSFKYNIESQEEKHWYYRLFSLIKSFFIKPNFGKYEHLTWKYDERGDLRDDYEMSDYPVINVSWYDAVQYCKWLSELTGENYRLPTFTEWLFSAYGGEYPNLISVNSLDSLGWFKENSDLRLHKVGEKKPNKLGIYDLIGNLREWCLDSPHNNPERRIVANGSWLDSRNCNEIGYKEDLSPYIRSNILGFRVVKEIK